MFCSADLCWTSAFDTVDHRIMLSRLKCLVGVSGSALKWFTSYLSEQSFSVAASKRGSSPASLSWCSLYSNVLNPLKYICYLCYANDFQLMLISNLWFALVFNHLRKTAKFIFIDSQQRFQFSKYLHVTLLLRPSCSYSLL